MRNYSNENEFDMHENEHVGKTHFHMNGFAPRLVLKQRQRELGIGLLLIRTKYHLWIPNELPHLFHLQITKPSFLSLYTFEI